MSFLLFQVVVLAQNNITVSGTVTDEQGQPLPGASVVLEGTTTGIQTDFDGNYTLDNVPGDGSLVFSYVGFTSQTIPINSRTTINLTMQEDTQSLDEVVVVGYGTQKKADLTGSIATVKSEDIARTPSGAAMQALQGKVAGLQVVSPPNGKFSLWRLSKSDFRVTGNEVSASRLLISIPFTPFRTRPK